MFYSFFFSQINSQAADNSTHETATDSFYSFVHHHFTRLNNYGVLELGIAGSDDTPSATPVAASCAYASGPAATECQEARQSGSAAAGTQTIRVSCRHVVAEERGNIVSGYHPVTWLSGSTSDGFTTTLRLH